MLKDLHKQTEFADKAELRIGDIKGYGLFYAGTEYTPPARGTWTIAHTPMLVPELHEIFVCPDGCLRGVVLSALEGGFMNRFSMISVRDEDLYNGRMEELFIEGVSDIINKLNPKPRAVMVFSSCIHDLMALDRNHIFDELQRKFPDIDILNALMNCTMRKSGLNYEEVQ